MLKYTDAQVTFSEIPSEITLCINLSNCPYHCPDCHSKYLWEDVGEELTSEVLQSLINKNEGISCVCFMGGDSDLAELKARFAECNPLKTAWYTGRSKFPSRDITDYLDYIKIGPYKAERGPLNNPNTNQVFYTKGSSMRKMDATENMWYDTTYNFWKNDTNS